VFHGVPPALPPLGILHLFEVDELEVDTIMAPPPEALAENIAREVEERLAAMQEVEAEAADVELTDDLTPRSDGGGLDVIASVAGGDDAGITGAVEAEQAEPGLETAAVADGGESFYVETTPSPQDGWLTLVVPMEGYSLQVPETWQIDEHSSFLEVSGPDGWSLSVRRHPGRNSLPGLAETRLGEVRSQSAAAARISMSMDRITAGDSMRLVRPGAGNSENWIEHIVVRAPLGARGLGYSLVFIQAGPGSPVGHEMVDEIMHTFILLGMETAAE
jgi:hypothetical protein